MVGSFLFWVFLDVKLQLGRVFSRADFLQRGQNFGLWVLGVMGLTHVPMSSFLCVCIDTAGWRAAGCWLQKMRIIPLTRWLVDCN